MALLANSSFNKLLSISVNILLLKIALILLLVSSEQLV